MRSPRAARTHRGAILVEPMLTIFVLGIVTMTVVSGFKRERHRATLAAIRADLHKVRTAQEHYYQTHDLEYARGIEQLSREGSFRPSRGVSVEVIPLPNELWEASATHSESGLSCQLGPTDIRIECGYVNPDEDRET